MSSIGPVELSASLRPLAGAVTPVDPATEHGRGRRPGPDDTGPSEGDEGEGPADERQVQPPPVTAPGGAPPAGPPDEWTRVGRRLDVRM